MRIASEYWQLSRAPRYSILFALPLLVAYEGLAALLSNPGGAGVRNGADVIIKSLFIAMAGVRGPMIFMAVLIGVSIWLVVRDTRKGGGIRWRIFLGMLAESVVLALVFGVVVGTITARLLAPFATMALAPVQRLGPATQLMVSLGAGLYEELLFRVVLVTALVAAFQRVAGFGATMAKAAAVVVGAVIFSAFHYIGPYGDPLQLPSFVFRTIGGLAFSALYVTRGFGITAWTHALYDVFLIFA
jgi:hypothetical protein